MSTLRRSGDGGIGQAQRRSDEELQILAGMRGVEGRRAVRHDELREAVLAILQEEAEKAARVEALDTDQQEQIADFREKARRAGLYAWQLSSRFNRPNTLNPPPAGVGGGALFLERDVGVGTFIASNADGERGDNETRLFTMSTSGTADDWGQWREILTQDSILGQVLMGTDGLATGALFQTISNSNGTVVRLASGLQIAFRVGGLTATRADGDRLEATWSYPAAFSSAPAVFASLPSTINGSYTGLSAMDVGAIAANPGSGSVDLAVRRDVGAPAYAVGASVTNISAFAIGSWS